MKRNFEKLIEKAGADVRLSEGARARMRRAVFARMRERPRAATHVLTPSPYAPFLGGIFAYAKMPAARVFSALVIVALAGGSLAYAAEGTLPGDALYPIKVGITEPARAYLAVTPLAKASWEMTLAARRIDEAATLSAQGILASSTARALASAFDAHAQNAVADADSARAQNPASAQALSASFATRLAAYNVVLAHVDARSHGRTDETLRKAVVRRAALFASAATSSPRTEGGKERQEEDVAHLGTNVSAALRDSADLIGAVRDELDASSTVSAESELEAAMNLAAKGDDLLRNHDAEGARSAFQDSLSATARLDVLTHAAATLKIPAFSSPAPSESEESRHDSTPTSHGKRGRHGGRSPDDFIPTTPPAVAPATSSPAASSASPLPETATTSVLLPEIFSSTATSSSETQPTPSKKNSDAERGTSSSSSVSSANNSPSMQDDTPPVIPAPVPIPPPAPAPLPIQNATSVLPFGT